MRHTDMTAAEVKALQLASMTERQFQDAVVKLAHSLGWKAVYFRAARVVRGGIEKYETAIGGDGRGWVDLHLSKPGRRTLYVEAKSETGRLRPDQIIWRDHLLACGEEWRLWHPRDWESIVEELSQ